MIKIISIFRNYGIFKVLFKEMHTEIQVILWFGFALKLMKVISIRDCKRTTEKEIQKL